MKIFLIGFMGAGKSYWGKQWADHYSYSFIDTDEQIIEKENQDIASIFEKKGEIYFREKETELLKELSKYNHTIIACGGGTPCFNNNMQWMNAHGITIYLHRSIDELYKNIVNDNQQRPLLNNLDEKQLRSFIEKKLSERVNFYEQANITLKNDEINLHSLHTIITTY